jgi:hypothetical protein
MLEVRALLPHLILLAKWHCSAPFQCKDGKLDLPCPRTLGSKFQNQTRFRRDLKAERPELSHLRARRTYTNMCIISFSTQMGGGGRTLHYLGDHFCTGGAVQLFFPPPYSADSSVGLISETRHLLVKYFVRVF